MRTRSCGRVSDCSALKTTGDAFTKAAIASATKWRYIPAHQGGWGSLGTEGAQVKAIKERRGSRRRSAQSKTIPICSRLVRVVVGRLEERHNFERPASLIALIACQ
jgi:hypothetical protein